MKPMRSCVVSLCLLTTCLILSGCAPKPGDSVKGLPDVPADAKLVLKDSNTKTEITLPENVRKKFIAALQSNAQFVDYSTVTAQPNATVQAGNYSIGWYGENLIQGSEKSGRRWSPPFAQAFKSKFGYDKPTSSKDWEEFIKSIDK